MTPPPAKKLKKSIEGGGWKKSPATGNKYHSSAPLLRSSSLFFKLPPEVRLMIYSYLIRSGYPDVLRLCQKIHREAVEFIYRDGIHHVKGVTTADHLQRIGDKVQHVEIHTYLKNFVEHGARDVIYNFLGDLHPELIDTEISRENCWIYLTHQSLLWEPRTEERLVMILRVARYFNNVFLNMHESISQIYGPSDSRREPAIAEFESGFKALGNELEPYVGPSTWHDSPDPMNRFWIFHPRQEPQRGDWD